MHWWNRNIIEPGKLPLLLSLVAFIVTFVVTRTITRLIRSGHGPLRDHVTRSGLHVHHAVPGTIVLIASAFTAVATPSASLVHDLAAIGVGVGTSLVLDEFALILHLRDVYWTAEGRVSVEMACLAVACLGLPLIGCAPFGVDDMDHHEIVVRSGALATTLTTIALVVVCVVKGKPRLALFGIFLPFVAWIGALRLARPNSPWARHRYDNERRRRARIRSQRSDARWDPWFDRVSDLIGGRPSA